MLDKKQQQKQQKQKQQKGDNVMMKMLACKKMAKLSLLPGCLAFLAGVAQAADLTWTGAASSVWDTQTANWQDENGIACVWADGTIWKKT